MRGYSAVSEDTSSYGIIAIRLTLGVAHATNIEYNTTAEL